MANAKISDLAEDTTADDDDILYGTNAAGTVDKRFSVLTIRGASLAPIGGHCTVATDDGVTTITVAVEDDDDLGGSSPSDLVIPTQGNVFNFFANRFRYVELGSTYTHTQSNTTLANVSGLSLSVAANAVYKMECFLPYISASGSGQGLKVGFTGPSGATLDWTGRSLNGSAVSGGAQNLQGRRRAISEAETFGGQGNAATDDLVATPKGWLKTSSTAGTFQLQAAQGSASATNTQILAGAILELTRYDTDG